MTNDGFAFATGVLLVEARQGTVADRLVLGIDAEGDRSIAGEDRRRGETGVDLRIVVTADVVRQTDGIDPSGTIDLPLATDRVGETVPETGTERIEIDDLDLRIVDRDRKIRDRRWIVQEMESDLPIAREMPRTSRRRRRWMRKLKDRQIPDREKNCETEGLSQVARKVAKVVPLAMRMKRPGE